MQLWTKVNPKIDPMKTVKWLINHDDEAREVFEALDLPRSAFTVVKKHGLALWRHRMPVGRVERRLAPFGYDVFEKGYFLIFKKKALSSALAQEPEVPLVIPDLVLWRQGKVYPWTHERVVEATYTADFPSGVAFAELSRGEHHQPIGARLGEQFRARVQTKHPKRVGFGSGRSAYEALRAATADLDGRDVQHAHIQMLSDILLGHPIELSSLTLRWHEGLGNGAPYENSSGRAALGFTFFTFDPAGDPYVLEVGFFSGRTRTCRMRLIGPDRRAIEGWETGCETILGALLDADQHLARLFEARSARLNRRAR